MSSRPLIGLIAGVAVIVSTNASADDVIAAGEDCAHIFVCRRDQGKSQAERQFRRGP
jgi:hypothetical protein